MKRKIHVKTLKVLVKPTSTKCFIFAVLMFTRGDACKKSASVQSLISKINLQPSFFTPPFIVKTFKVFKTLKVLVKRTSTKYFPLQFLCSQKAKPVNNQRRYKPWYPKKNLQFSFFASSFFVKTFKIFKTLKVWVKPTSTKYLPL